MNSKVTGHLQAKAKSKATMKSNLKMHTKSVHKGKRQFKCTNYKKNISYKKSLIKHFESVLEVKKPF